MNIITIQTPNSKVPSTEYQVPNSWNDLTLSQQYACYQILFSDSPDWIESHEVPAFKRLQLAQYLLNVTPEFTEAWQQDCQQAYGEDWETIYLSELDELLQITDGLFHITENEDGTKQYQVAFTLTNCPYPELSESAAVSTSNIPPSPHHPITLHAPTDKLDNLTLYEIGLVFTLFENYLQTKDEALADQLIASIYRPSKPATPENELMDYEGDRRIRYIESSVARRIPLIESLPPLTRKLILFWIASCRQHIVQDNPDIFQAPDEAETIDNRFGWAGVIMAMANTATDLDRVSTMLYKDAFLYLSYLEAQRLKAEQERMRMAARH